MEGQKVDFSEERFLEFKGYIKNLQVSNFMAKRNIRLVSDFIRRSDNEG